MGDARGSSEKTRAEILRVARDLFATRGIATVTVRDVAAAAGVTHALVHRYFGTKKELVADVLRRELEAASALPVSQDPEAVDPFEMVRRLVLYGLSEDASDTLFLITRAEIAGLEPEKMLPKEQRTPIGIMTAWLRQQQAEPGRYMKGAPDAAVLSAVIGGAIFGMQLVGPWLMTGVGLDPQDAVARRGEIADILVGLIARAAGLPAEQPAGPRE
jgi:TetR/AcrR family transcriptional regulator, repressor for neighboring sulfatase